MAGRYAVITGAASGIGRASAVALSARGYQLGLVDIDMDGLEGTAAGCIGPTPKLALCDVSVDHQVEQCLLALSATGTPEILINSAGIARYDGFLSLDTQAWRRQFDVNVLGTVNPIRALLPAMLARGSGLIINVGSRRGLEPKATTSAYSASKASVHALSSALNAEFGPQGISVSYLAPGGTKTGLASPKDQRFMEAATVAQAVVFMCDSYPAGWVRQLEILPPGL